MAEDKNCPSLPKGFVTVRDILEEKLPINSFANVIGIVTDFRSPTQTRGVDAKCEIRCFDGSVSGERSSIVLVVFRPMEKMPQVGCGDVILIRQAKIQQYTGDDARSLCTSYRTQIIIFEAGANRSEATLKQRESTDKALQKPTVAELKFIHDFYQHVDKSLLPTQDEFNQLVERSANIKDKFRLLQDTADQSFIDTVVEIVRDPLEEGDRMTLWVTDYTENGRFISNSTNGYGANDPGDDPYGYHTKFATNASGKSTAFLDSIIGGQRLFQVTLWEPQSTVIRDCRLKKGSWVQFRNLLVAYDRNATYLEGYMRQDKRYPQKINVSPLDPLERDRENGDLKEAIRRKHEYLKTTKNKSSAIEEAGEAGRKRKANLAAETSSEAPSAKETSREKRKRKRRQERSERVVQTLEVSKESKASDLNLGNESNPQVKFEGSHYKCATVHAMLETKIIELEDNVSTFAVRLPFCNANYRAKVRVVDFYPPHVSQFTRPKKTPSDMDILSEAESCSSYENNIPMAVHQGSWEWRFLLKLQDVSPLSEKATIWVVLDNQMTERLTGLTASDLSKSANKGVQDAFLEKMFTLWGNLEELKRQLSAQGSRRNGGLRRGSPPNSDDEQESLESDDPPLHQIQNLPFDCCIRQYGIKVPERDFGKADAGDQKRWQRVYGMFGTRIMS